MQLVFKAHTPHIKMANIVLTFIKQFFRKNIQHLQLSQHKIIKMHHLETKLSIDFYHITIHYNLHNLLSRKLELDH